ncbi:hypothetical protein G3O08_15280 [Cryomorpha ignava]|uniref:Tetratricopeptide repeat protein n=1 Tax=Cryomorpha ignava TaxID=101383 RepID=A0A7K3WTP6_9FLAO|nr:PD40 domain-containing protein [Cryomorpha ignava]NEN24864.1 hypothetical protein [Cryomorpha ignava]
MFKKAPHTLIIVSVLLCCLVNSAKGQNPKEAHSLFLDGNYFKAIDLYSSLLEKEPNNPEYNLNIGLSYLRTNIDPKLALDYLLKSEAEGKFDNSLLLQIARAHTHHLDYESALHYLHKYRLVAGKKDKNKAEYEKIKADCNTAQDLLKYPVNVNFTNLGENINSTYPDYNPFVTSDGSRMVFTTRRKVRPGSHPEFDGYYPSDIMMSFRKDGKWFFADRLSDKINTIYDEQTVGLTSTGDTLFFYIDHVSDVGDIFTSIYKNKTYSDPKRLGDGINGVGIESSCSLSQDGQTMLFSSNRPGGTGDFDLYMIKRDGINEWEEPINLGQEINTELSEDYPTLSPDGNTLYFCSNGHPGMGGYDLYFSTWDEQSQQWTKPQNMGYPINSPNDEKNISFMKSGKTAVMAALRTDTYGDLDIYQVDYEKTESDSPALFVLNVSLPQGEAMPELQIRDAFDEPVGSYYPNRITGRYVLALHPGKYFIYIDAPGYNPYTEVLVVNKFHTRQDNNVRFIKLQSNRQ